MAQLHAVISLQQIATIDRKLLLYKTIRVSIWACDVQLWGTVSSSNMEILQIFQNRYLRIIVNVTNDILHRNLNVIDVRRNRRD